MTTTLPPVSTTEAESYPGELQQLRDLLGMIKRLAARRDAPLLHGLIDDYYDDPRVVAAVLDRCDAAPTAASDACEGPAGLRLVAGDGRETVGCTRHATARLVASPATTVIPMPGHEPEAAEALHRARLADASRWQTATDNDTDLEVPGCWG